MGYSVEDLTLRNRRLPIIRNFVDSVYVRFTVLLSFLNIPSQFAHSAMEIKK